MCKEEQGEDISLWKKNKMWWTKESSRKTRHEKVNSWNKRMIYGLNKK